MLSIPAKSLSLWSSSHSSSCDSGLCTVAIGASKTVRLLRIAGWLLHSSQHPASIKSPEARWTAGCFFERRSAGGRCPRALPLRRPVQQMSPTRHSTKQNSRNAFFLLNGKVSLRLQQTRCAPPYVHTSWFSLGSSRLAHVLLLEPASRLSSRGRKSK